MAHRINSPDQLQNFLTYGVELLVPTTSWRPGISEFLQQWTINGSDRKNLIIYKTSTCKFSIQPFLRNRSKLASKYGLFTLKNLTKRKTKHKQIHRLHKLQISLKKNQIPLSKSPSREGSLSIIPKHWGEGEIRDRIGKEREKIEWETYLDGPDEEIQRLRRPIFVHLRNLFTKT